MPEELKVYSLDDAANKYESMTKEQIITAITQAVNEGTISNIDAGFITKIQEMNKKGVLKWWIGTQAEFNALSTKDNDTLYLFTDDPLFNDFKSSLASLDTEIDALDSRVTQANTSLLKVRTLITRNRSIVRNHQLAGIQGNGSVLNLTPFSLDIDKSELCMGEGVILYSLHLDLELNSLLSGDRIPSTTSIDIPFRIKFSMTGNEENISVLFLDGRRSTDSDITFLMRTPSTNHINIVTVELKLERELINTTGLDYVTLKFKPTELQFSGVLIDYSSSGGNATVNQLEISTGSIDVLTAYVERVGAKIGD